MANKDLLTTDGLHFLLRFPHKIMIIPDLRSGPKLVSDGGTDRLTTFFISGGCGPGTVKVSLFSVNIQIEIEFDHMQKVTFI